ncbi:hypothetical protein RJ639_029317 [Escallonia herrerae]|uniref:DUF4378 domain-containing protein n=1 Tax=Escallonia herrerae TaxID=1293975 RepID=A0AA88X262_9ASTE|nr:hypothetical protein RJ639_029317 [Escallonia herrerae]
MVKNLRHQGSSISVEDGNPGCMWNVIHALHHHRWRHVRKRLPHRRHAAGSHHSGKQSALASFAAFAELYDLVLLDFKFKINCYDAIAPKAYRTRDHAISSFDAIYEATVVGDPGSSTTSTDGEMQKNVNAEMDNSLIEGKTGESSLVNKSSVKSRIRTFIVEEMSKRRGRQHRSSSYPTRLSLTRTASIHHLEPSDLDTSDELGLHAKSPRAYEEPTTKNRKCVLCATMLAVSYLTQGSVDEQGEKLANNHTPLQDNVEKTQPEIFQQKLTCAEETIRGTSVLEAEQLLDALNVFNMKKDLFVKILQDPSSPLAQYLLNHRAQKSRIGLTKSMSFPLAGSAGKRTVMPRTYKSKQGGKCDAAKEEQLQVGNRACIPPESEFTQSAGHSLPLIAGFNEEGNIKPILPVALENPSRGSPRGLKNRRDDKRVIKRFKNLRQKIKQAIRDSRKERHRIVMDAVFDKIPYGRRSFKDVKVDIVSKKRCKYSPGSSFGSDQFSAIGKGGRPCIRRTSSFNESLDTYNRLYESSFNRDAKHHIFQRLKLRPEETPSPVGTPMSIGRIRSLPDLRSYCLLQSEDSPGSSGTPSRIMVGSTVCRGRSKFDEIKALSFSVGSEKHFPLDGYAESEEQENLIESGKTENDLHNVTTGENASPPLKENEIKLSQCTKLSESIPNPMLQSSYEEDKTDPSSFSTPDDSKLTPSYHLDDGTDSLANQESNSSKDSPTGVDNLSDVQKVECPVKPHYRSNLPQEAFKDNVEFNYVRDVLELSGFSGNEFLEAWHSSDQPLNPLVFEEVEGCLLDETHTRFDEEGIKSNHLLLFDLINEVLLDIHEKSFTYYPLHLTCRSHVRPMPVGYHVLEEVWVSISEYLSWRPELDQSLDDSLCRDLAKGDGWMNLQFDAECVGLELEAMIFYDLLEEII